MDSAALATLSRLLDQALDQPPSERAAWIDALGPGYDDVKPRLLRLVSDAALLTTHGPFDTLPKWTMAAGDPLSDGDPQPGTDIGPYRLVRLLGEGGMGQVWLAERPDGMLKRPVALKLPRGFWQRAALAERIARERDILAALSHPHIARLYDAGIASDGQPYLALEYVDGQPLDVYCRDRALGVRDRLALFLQIVSAIAHAHAQLVVHRDLKPSNLLVTRDGEVRLLDFGIAKLLEQEPAGETALTQLSGRALTPDYASPEQIRGHAIGTASDIYSLGVVLYELLTGVRPYMLPRDTPAALEEAILEADPRRPSHAAADAAGRRALRGDLDWIVLKAMAKEPGQRYASAAALAGDIERHLRDEPVEAGPPGAGYRIRKFVRRHRVAVAASAIVVVALVTGIVGTTAGLLRARRAEADARNSAERAQTEARTSERVSRFLVDMFDLAKPEEAGGRPVTARDMLDRGAARIGSELEQQPAVRARLRRAVGDAYSQLGLYPEARPQLEQAVAAARAAGAEGERELVGALTLLGQLQRRVDDAAGAERSLREALRLVELRPGSDPDELGLILNELALLLRTSHPDEALALYRRTYDLIVAAKGPEHGDAGGLLLNIGALQARMRRFAEARDTYEQSLPILTNSYGDADPRVGVLLGNLAMVERMLGNLDRALELQQRDLAVSSRIYAADHPTLASARINLARINEDAGDYDQALEQIDTALSILHKHFKPQHGLILTGENTRALLYTKLGRAAEARAVLERLVGMQPDSPEADVALATSRIQLSHHERLAGRFARALALTTQVIDSQSLSGNKSIAADAAWAQACVLAAQETHDDAERWRRRALEIQTNDAQATAADRLHLHARHYACAGDPEQAIALLRQAVDAGYRNPAIHVDPSFAAVRRHPDFAAAVRPIRAPDTERRTPSPGQGPRPVANEL